jgi:HEAT repeat protein
MESDDPQTAALIAMLDQHDKQAIRAAVDDLIQRAADSPQLRNTLNHRLIEAEHQNYWPVAYILGNLPNPSSAAIAGLLEALDHRDPDIRWAIALLLVRIAKQSKDRAVINSLIQLCAAGSDNQKRMALYAIRDLSLSDAASLTALLTALHDSEPTVRVAAAICLKPRRDVDDAGKHLLLRLYLNDVELKVRHAVAITLATLGAPQADFVLALKENTRSENEQTKKAAIAALALLEKRRSAPAGSASSR